ncbi:MAG: type V CRISPR-associated protein Cas12k [Lyngbya sp. HA4199-MV5]|jgi:hypothetical protein|nr:type V CRISPR-associated protein Cas12k [Lyngbya sp. HA4199-MV5]
MSKSTFLFRLDALGDASQIREENRRYYWELMTQQHTPLINQLNLKVAQHPNFADWQINNAVNADELKSLWRSFKEHPQFETMPERAFVSARLVVGDTYESWLALQGDRQEELAKLSNSLEVLKTDAELVAISGCSLDAICSKAREILSQANTQVAGESKKKSKKAINGGIYKVLYEKHRIADDPLKKCAAAYLIKNRFEIKGDETEEDIEHLKNRIHCKEKQIELLLKQLQSRLPKGRPWVGDGILDEIKSIGVVEDEAEWNLVESALLKQQTFLPHPMLFHSSDDLIWFEHERPPSQDSTTEDERKPNAESSRRVCVRFKSFDEKYAFEISGDRRHLHILQQALRERMIYDSDIDGNTSKLFLVRSATLIWKEYRKNENRIIRRRKAANKRAKRIVQSIDKAPEIQSAPAFYNPEFPWNRYQLFLHCTVETEFLSQEGTELVIQQQRKPIIKALQTLEERMAESENKGESTQTRKANHSRKTGTLRRIDSYDNNYDRPSKPLYAGIPHILTGVALGSGGLVTVTIVDATSGKILGCRGLKALLGDNYRLVNRRQFQRQLNLRRRTERQKRGASSQSGESNLGDAIDQHTANAVLDFAKKHHSGCIVLPDMKDYRVRQQSEIAALAERECSGWKGIEKRFAKAQNMKIHAWSYGRLMEYIRNQAHKGGILVKIGQQPLYGSSQEQAGKMAIDAYQNKTVPKNSP